MAIKIQYENIRTDLKLGDIVVLDIKTSILDSKAKISTNYQVTKIEEHKMIDEKGTTGYTSIQIEAI